MSFLNPNTILCLNLSYITKKHRNTHLVFALKIKKLEYSHRFFFISSVLHDLKLSVLYGHFFNNVLDLTVKFQIVMVLISYSKLKTDKERYS